ncbi:hypothetical protein SAMN05444422_101237 [Halobiforma haloterrestris]|uniref:Uncharacterized protein n=1 Tax=Natronobacterium haloterrestre TaxID=148448 RepID=A0A1I1D305_NATHA|nr:hypothetical protein [Halobiforma haloterrestris]SFB69315.1 hypothetical protein SAMN05444422_101237 [Halobiforma haloterrestris]
MPTPPTPHETVPDFIVERFEDHSAEELRAIADYAETLEPGADVPNYVVRAFSIQDDETRTVVAVYASELAEFREAKAAGAGDEDENEGGDEDEGEEDLDPGRMGGAFFG